MRKRYITSHKKLPIIVAVLLLAFSTVAKKKEAETNIVCFAAKNKWVCAPEGRQELANKKAAKLLEKSKSELKDPNIVIRTIDIPKFQSIVEDKKKPVKTSIIENKAVSTQSPVNANKSSVANKNPHREAEIIAPNKQQENPYAKLWSHQLVGVSTPQNAVNFVKKHNLNKEDVLIIKSIRDNKEWWIVLSGLYKNRRTGLENEKNLPNTINSHWLRSLKNLKVLGFIEKY